MKINNIRKCCDEMEDVLNCEKGLDIDLEGNICMENAYIVIEFIYCPFCGKKLERISECEKIGKKIIEDSHKVEEWK